VKLPARLKELTCNECAGTLKIIASLKMGLRSPFFVEVLFVWIFFSCCSRYTCDEQFTVCGVISWRLSRHFSIMQAVAYKVICALAERKFKSSVTAEFMQIY
jgi:uncharacterized membrane protein YwaF